MTKQPLRVGVGGPVGSGKTALMEQLCKRLCEKLRHRRHHQRHLHSRRTPSFWPKQAPFRPSAFSASRRGAARIPRSARTLLSTCGGRRDAEALSKPRPDPHRIGRDNLAATFSPELADLTIYVIDVSGGEKIPRKGGPGITRSDLLVINKTDLAPYVGASLEVMARDATTQRKSRPFVMTNMKTGEGVDAVIAFLRDKGGLKAK